MRRPGVGLGRDHLDEAARQAAALIALADPGRPVHVGTLLGNGPPMLTAMAAAGLGGYVLAGINTTRRSQSLTGDIRRADCQILLTDAGHRGLLDGSDLSRSTPDPGSAAHTPA